MDERGGRELREEREDGMNDCGSCARMKSNVSRERAFLWLALCWAGRECNAAGPSLSLSRILLASITVGRSLVRYPFVQYLGI